MEKPRKPSILQSRGTWIINPVSRVKESKKKYSRKNYKIDKDEE